MKVLLAEHDADTWANITDGLRGFLPADDGAAVIRALRVARLDRSISVPTGSVYARDWMDACDAGERLSTCADIAIDPDARSARRGATIADA